MRRRWFDYALLLLFLGAPAPAAAQSFCGPFLSVPTSNFDGDVLFGVSYFGAIGIPEAQLTRLRDDLDFFKSRGFNNIRVWANWAVQDAQDSTILDANGNLIPDAVDRLKVILDEAADRDLTVDLTFSWRSFYEDLNGGHCSDPESCANGEPCFEDNWDDFVGGIADAADTLASPVYFDGVFFDLANEHNAGCSPVFKLNRDEVEELSAAVFAEDPQRILTVSAIEDGDWVDRYVDFLGGATVDFPTPHFDRDELWAIETGVNVENLRQDLLPERYPIHLQEERRYCLRQICGDECTDECEPADFLLALANAASYGAGGWNFHTRAGYELEEGTLRFYERLEHDHEQETLDCTLALSLDCLAEQLTASRCAPPPRLLDTFTGGPARPETNPPPTEYNLIDRVTEVGTGDWQVDGSDPGTQGWALKVIRDPGVVTFNLTQQQKAIGGVPFRVPAGFNGVISVEADIDAGTDVSSVLSIGFSTSTTTELGTAGQLWLMMNGEGRQALRGPGYNVLAYDNCLPQSCPPPHGHLELQYNYSTGTATTLLDGSPQLQAQVPFVPNVQAVVIQIDTGTHGDTLIDNFEASISAGVTP